MIPEQATPGGDHGDLGRTFAKWQGPVRTVHNVTRVPEIISGFAPDDRRVAIRRRPARAVVRGISAGGPDHEVLQDEVRATATDQFPDVYRSPEMLAVFDNAGVERRRFARPLPWYVQEHGFGERNAVYVEEALALSERHARLALEQAGLTPADIEAVVFVSSTGVSTPSLDAALIARLGIDGGVARLPLWGLGCAGGAAGLSRANDMVRAGYRNVLLVAVELCSLTFVLGDDSKANFIGTALFADGCAALVVGAESDGDAGLVQIVATHGALIPDTSDMTGWDVVDAGFKLRLSKEIPMLMGAQLRPIVDASLDEAGWTLEDVDTVVVHPGGAKVITGYEYALDLDDAALDATRAVLRDHGNMSSPTVLFVLEEALRRGATGRGLISASGPGFAVEHLLVEFPA